MASFRLALSIALLFCGNTFAQTYFIGETTQVGDSLRITAETTLRGTLKISRDGKLAPVAVTAKNEHAFHERVLATDRVATGKALRFYQSATSHAEIGGAATARSLLPQHRLILAHRSNDGLSCFSPQSPLTRSELEIVSEHFETLHLAGLLPDKAIEVGASWKVGNEAAQSICLMEGLISHDLTGKLKEVTGRSAAIIVEGSAKGIEYGAMVSLSVTATLTFDLDAKRIVAVEWQQKDAREQGPVTPAAELESKTVLKRLVAAEPPELAQSRISNADEFPASARLLTQTDPKGRYRLLHDRNWHTVVQTDHHLVFRLLDRGDLVAQATLTYWTNAEAGKHMSPEEFERVVGKDWKMEQVLDRTEVPTDSDRWAYRIVATGELDGAKVTQHFFVVAGKNGEQVIVTFTMRQVNATRLGTRDLAIVNAIDFVKK